MKSASQILAAFNRGELAPQEADRALSQWDDERVELEAQEAFVADRLPDFGYPAALWERFWELKLETVLAELRIEFRVFPYMAEDPEPWEQVRPHVLTPSVVEAALRSRGCGDCPVTFDLFGSKQILVRRPPLPRNVFSFMVRQVEG